MNKTTGLLSRAAEIHALRASTQEKQTELDGLACAADGVGAGNRAARCRAARGGLNCAYR